MNLVSVSSRWWEYPPLLTQQLQQQHQLWPNRSPPRKRRRRPPDSSVVIKCLILVLLFQIVKLANGSITQEDANIALSLTTTTMAPNSTSSNSSTNSSSSSNSHHPHPHPHSHHHHSKHSHHHPHHPHSNNLSSILSSSTTTSSLIIKHNNDDDAETLPLLPLPPETSPSLISTTFDHTIHVDKNNPKGLKFEEEPSDSYIVRSKSAILRCRTLNALNAWFTCNSGDERRIQSNQKISNYVDPQTGIRLIEIDLEITRSDVEEHQNSGYTNPFQCWCTAYGGHHQIMSRKASVSFAYLKKHFHVEPKSVTVELNSNKPVQFKCVPPFGVPEPVIFWMRNDVIILESEPHDTTSGSSSSSVDSGAAMKSSHKPHYFTEKFLRNKKNFPTKKSSKNKTIVSQKTERAAPEPEGDDDEEDDDEDYDEDEELEYDASKQPEKEIGSDDDNDDDGGGEDAGDLLLPHHFDLAAEHHPDGKNIPINYHMADDHSLVIKHVTMEDQANYTCGVYNVAGVRFTKPATLTVFVNGEWSNWGSWSPCQLAPGSTTQGMKCGIGTQKRVRHCNNPAPVNNGQFCPGESVQVTECTILCPPIDGFWSPWTQWSTCSHECTQLRRRICNNPVPQYGGTDCFGTDFLVKNCTGGLCRKIFDSNNNFIQQSIGSAANQNNDQIYFIIIFILILIILTFVIYIVLKFQLHRRRHGAKTFHHTWFSGDSDHLSHGTIDAEDAAASRTLTPTLLLLQQQQDGRFYNKPIKVGSGSVGSAGLISSATPSPHPVNHYPMQPIKTTPNKHLLDKYHLVSRLNAAQGVDQFLLQQQQQSQPPSGQQSHPPKVPLPTIPRDDDSCSLVSSTGNRYEEPQFRLPPIINTSQHTVPNTGSHRPSATNNTATKNGSAAAGPGTNSSSGSAANTASTTANEMSNESEPDYAEPIINQEQNVLNLGANVISGYGPPNTPAPPLPMALPPSTPSVGMPQQQRPISDGSSPRYSSEEFSSGGSSSISSDDVGSLCGRHEKFVKINTDLIHYGHYSSMPNLGVALYLPPGFIHQPINQSLVGGVGDWYIRYGLDTRARFPGICSLSSVITLNMSKHHQVELNRPVILSFRHCLSFNHQQPQLDGSLLKNLVIFWQHNDQLKSSKWIELVHYGDNDDLNCFVHLDSENVYLITRLFGRFMFGFKHDFDSESTDSPLMESIGRQNREASLSKLINFAVTIEQFNSQEHLIKCYVYDNLPASVLMFQNDQLPSSPTQHQLLKVMIGRMAPLPNVYKSTLKLSMPPNRKAALCFEIQTSCRLIKGSKRMEIPLDHLCSMGPNSMLHCSFIVAASNLDDNEEIVDDISNDSNDSESSEEDPSSPTYQNHLKLLRKFRNLDYDIKVWQQKLEIRKRSHHHFHPSDQVTLNRLNMSQLRRLPGNIGHFHQEECIRLFGDAELNLRRILIERLDSGWRQWASTYLAVYPLEVARLLAFLAAQHPSPSYQLMEIWESKTIHEMIVDCGKKKRSNNVHGSNKFVDSPRRIQQQQQQQTLMSMNPIKMKEIFFARLLHQLKTIRRSDLVELILGHQF